MSYLAADVVVAADLAGAWLVVGFVLQRCPAADVAGVPDPVAG